MDVITRLLQAGADVAVRNDRGMVPLHIAAGKKFIEGIRELLKLEWGGEHLVHARDRSKK